MTETEKPGYLISFAKQTSMLGESVQISTNLPYGATSEQIGVELIKIGNALDMRMKALNDVVLARTGKNLKDVGIDTGTEFLEEHVAFQKENNVYKKD